MLENRILLTALAAWLIAQTIKLTVALFRTRRVDFCYMVSSGGMPSAHAALVTALAVAVGQVEGTSSALFALAAVFAAVVMYDAAGVRQAVSMQARVLNRMIDDFFTEHHFREQRLLELLGHTRLEVFVGFVLGVIVGLLGTR